MNHLSNKKLIILYSLIAGVSTIMNIGSQMLSLYFYKGIYSIEISIFVGTLVGLPIRYVLDKKYIFFFETKNIVHDGQLFVLYGCMSVFTTLIFWGTEYSFYWYFNTDFMRYLGGIIGLTVGYYVKYNLDKRFIFYERSRA